MRQPGHVRQAFAHPGGGWRLAEARGDAIATGAEFHLGCVLVLSAVGRGSRRKTEHALGATLRIFRDRGHLRYADDVPIDALAATAHFHHVRLVQADGIERSPHLVRSHRLFERHLDLRATHEVGAQLRTWIKQRDDRRRVDQEADDGAVVRHAHERVDTT
jgi:hypothetical protein